VFAPLQIITYKVERIEYTYARHTPICSRSQGAARTHVSPTFSICNHFVFWEAVSPTKYCCLPKVKRFPPKNFLMPQMLCWLRHWCSWPKYLIGIVFRPLTSCRRRWNSPPQRRAVFTKRELCVWLLVSGLKLNESHHSKMRLRTCRGNFIRMAY